MSSKLKKGETVMNSKIPVKELLNAKFSRFSSLLSVHNCSDTNLIEWSEEIRSEKHKAKIDQIRSFEKGSKRDSIKKALPCVTISGVCKNGRGKGKELSSHSRLLQL